MMHPLLGQIVAKAYKRYYQRAPPSVRRYISPLLFFLKFRIIARLFHLHLRTYLVQGVEKFSGEQVTLLFFGDDISFFYFSELLFDNIPHVRKLGMIYIWNVHKFLHRYSANVDAVIVHTDRFFSRFLQKKNFITLPAWLELKLDVTPSIDALSQQFTKSALEDIRIIKKNQYSYATTDDPDTFEYFYHKIRIPYLSQRLGQLTIPTTTNYEETKDIFERGELFLIQQKNDIVSGFFLITKNRRAHACYMGIANPSYYLSKGAGAALYYFSILWAKEHHMKLLDFGNNRSFLNNGSFQYKKKWGCSVSRSKRFFDIFGLNIINYKSKAIRSFLINNPFTYVNNHDLCGVVFLPELFFLDDIKKIQDIYYTPGIQQLFVVTLKNNLDYILTEIFEKQTSVELRTTDSSCFDNKPLSSVILSNEKSSGKISITSLVVVDEGKQNSSQNRKKRHKQLMNHYQLNTEQATQLISSGYEKRFEELVRYFPQLANVIFGTFLNTFPMLKRRGVNLEKIDNSMLIRIFSALSENKCEKEAIPSILQYLGEHNTKTIEQAMKACDIHLLSEEKAGEIIRKIVKEHREFIRKQGDDAHRALMGIVMKKLRGKVDGEVVSQLLKKEIRKVK